MPSRSFSCPTELAGLYRQARTLPGADFAAAAFAWLCSRLPFDAGTLVTSFVDRPAYVDAHFHGIADPAATLESWSRVQHLDSLSPLLLANPLRAQRQDIDDPRIAGEHHAPLREHLARFRFTYSICIAVQVDDGRGMTVLILVRHENGSRFAADELQQMEQLAPHLAEASAINRGMALLRSPQLGIDQIPLALADAGGALVQTTAAFVRLFWNGQAPQTTQLDAECLDAIRRGGRWPLPDGIHVLRAEREADGWLLRVQPGSRLDCLSARECTIAGLFADGASYKQIAQQLRLAPATVRNHLQKIYAKLGVKHRVELIAAIGTGKSAPG